MKRSVLAICMIALLTSFALAPAPAPAPAAALNDKYVLDKAWAQAPADLPWNAAVSSIAADGKGNVVVLVITETVCL